MVFMQTLESEKIDYKITQSIEMTRVWPWQLHIELKHK